MASFIVSIIITVFVAMFAVEAFVDNLHEKREYGGKIMFSHEEKYAKCQNEQQFKMAYIKNNVDSSADGNYVFCIETEETVMGFPDVLKLSGEVYGLVVAQLYEFKMSNRSGTIKFKPSQPSFYRSHNKLNICVIAYNAKSHCVHIFKVSELFAKDGNYALSDKGTVSLTKAEEAFGGNPS